MTDEQIISRFDALRDDAALKLLHRIFCERFGECDEAVDAMHGATQAVCNWIAESELGFDPDYSVEALIDRVIEKPVQYRRAA